MGAVRGARVWLVAVGAIIATGLSAALAQARAPVIAYQDPNTRQLHLYDVQAAAAVPAPALTFRGFVQIPFAVSFDGRYVAYVADATSYDIHLFDRVSGSEIPLPGIDIYTSTADHPSDLSVSDNGLIAFDDVGNGGVVVYDSATSGFVSTGLPSDSKTRQPVLSGDGRFLATTCITGPGTKCPDPDLNSGSATLFVQDLVTQKDTGLPPIDPTGVSGMTDYEHPCLDNTGDLVGADAKEAAGHPAVYIYDRSANKSVDIADLNDPLADTVRCSLSFGGRYVGVEDSNGNVRLLDRNTGTQIPVDSSVIGPPAWFTAPFVAPNPPAVAAPANGAIFTQHQQASAAYSCTDPDGGLGLTSCVGSVGPGAPIDTTGLGTHHFTVTATDVNGLTSATTVTYSVVAPGGGGGAGPTVSQVRLSHRRWRESHSRVNPRVPVGTTFFFTLSQAGAVKVSFVQRLGGHRRRNGRCSTRLRQGGHCTLSARRGSFTVQGHQGLNRLAFTGRIPRSRTLHAGRYTVTFAAVSAVGQRSRARTVSFTIVS